MITHFNKKTAWNRRKDFKIVPGTPFLIQVVQFKTDKWGLFSPCLMITPARKSGRFTFLEEMIEQVLEEAKEAKIIKQEEDKIIEDLCHNVGYETYYALRVNIKKIFAKHTKMSHCKSGSKSGKYLETESIELEVLPYIDEKGELNYKTIRKVVI
jgi:hypothetical protein